MCLTPLQKDKAKGSYNIQDEKSKLGVMLTKKDRSEGKNLKNLLLGVILAFQSWMNDHFIDHVYKQFINLKISLLTAKHFGLYFMCIYAIYIFETCPIKCYKLNLIKNNSTVSLLLDYHCLICLHTIVHTMFAIVYIVPYRLKKSLTKAGGGH